MFATPSWLGSFITSRSNQEINELNRKHDVIMEDIKHKHEYLIQESRNKVTEDVARMNRESAEEIARLTREHDAQMTEARNKNAVAVALINAASKTTNTALPYVFPAFMAGKLSNNNKSDTNGKSNSTTSNTGVSVAKMTKQEKAQKKADDLFPELEPTFGVTLLDNAQMPKINVTQLVPAIGAVLSVAAPLLAIL